MGFSLDHIVIAVTDFEEAVTDYRRLGFTVYPGGTHHGGVSHNALVIFADGSYFELIAYLKDAPETRWWQILSRAGEGLVDFTLLPNDTLLNLANARARGLELTGPIDGGRLRPDGARLDWQIVRPATTDLPFWCGDVTPRTLRVPEGEMRKHANGATGISRVTVAVSQIDASTARYAALVGPEFVRRKNQAVTVSIGQATIELAGGAAAQSHIAQRGEGPVSILLRGPAQAMLDPALTHGVPLAIAP